MNCRFCGHSLSVPFIDLGSAPPTNSFLTRDQLVEPEIYFPLKLYVCDGCHLVQIDEYKKSTDIFDAGYIYFSSYSTSWLEHCKNYVNHVVQRFGFNEHSLVIEIASNDGYLLQYFREKRIPCLGIEPSSSTAKVAQEKGIETVVDFFGTKLAQEMVARRPKADLILGNNVLAHVPDINDFVQGMKIFLKPGGIITMEFPHLLQLVTNRQFDTIYHEHFSYLSFFTVTEIFRQHGLTLFDVEEIPTHGGSLRIYGRHDNDASKPVTSRATALLEKERTAGMKELAFYENFQRAALEVKNSLLRFLIETYDAKKKVAAYGAAAKGNTLLNYCGIRQDLVSFVVDKSPHKQGKFLPGCHIPVVAEEAIYAEKPDFMLILPWNLRDEIMRQLSYISGWGAHFVVAVPQLEII